MSHKKFKTGQELFDAYSNGFVGAYCNPEHLERFLSTLAEPTFKLAGARLRGTGAGKISLPFKSVFKVSPEKPYQEKQLVGDCVSHGTRNAVDVSRAVQIDVKHTMESFVALGATEGIYGCRGHNGDGMACSEAAEFVCQTGGILLRKNYGDIDLSHYEGDRGWGGSGVPRKLVEVAKEHQVKTMAQIRSIEEARDAIANGYGIAVCSNQGFSSRRDENGFAQPQGNWGHCMAWIACIDDGKLSFLVQNSWGPDWISGPKKYDQPDGSFWIHEDVADDMLKSDASFAFSAVNGFPPVKLPNYGSHEYL